MIHIYFDLDDTLVETHKEMKRLLKVNHDFVSKEEGYLTPENTDGLLSFVLESATFMLTAAPNEEIVRQIENIRAVLNRKVVSVNICTHRGYHKKAQQYTELMLKDNELEFDNVVYLDPKHQPDKMSFLRNLHGEKAVIILVDDKPTFTKEHQLDPFVLLIDKPWNHNLIIPIERRIVCNKTIEQKVLNLLGQAVVNRDARSLD